MKATKKPIRGKPVQKKPAAAPPANNTNPMPTGGPQFAEPTPTPDPTSFSVKHGSDTAAYTILDHEKNTLKPRPFPVVAGAAEPVVTLAEALGPKGSVIEKKIEAAEQIVFHAIGDTGNTKGPRDEGQVADKMVSDFAETDPREVPSFCYHLGDVVYSFGESEYYYDQFYDPYRDYPAPIFAIAGNHDGMVAPNTSTPTLQAFLENFCTDGQPPHRTPEAGGLARTAQIQPGVYYTLEVPFARVLGLYSNCLEDPGVISDQADNRAAVKQSQTYPYLGKTQVNFLKAALARVKKEKFAGAVLIAVHHPPYVAQLKAPATGATTVARHGGSPYMLDDIDSACAAVGVWPHAVISGHAHNYQRFTRTKDGRQTPFLVCGNSGHGITALTKKGTPAIRTPQEQPSLSDGNDTVVFENYDDQDFGYLRIIANAAQLRIEYHPATDGEDAKTPDDSVTVDLATYKVAPFRVAATV